MTEHDIQSEEIRRPSIMLPISSTKVIESSLLEAMQQYSPDHQLDWDRHFQLFFNGILFYTARLVAVLELVVSEI